MEKLLSRMNKFHSNAVKTIIHILAKSKGNSSTVNMPPRSKYEYYDIRSPLLYYS